MAKLSPTDFPLKIAPLCGVHVAVCGVNVNVYVNVHSLHSELHFLYVLQCYQLHAGPAACCLLPALEVLSSLGFLTNVMSWTRRIQLWERSFGQLL